MDAGDFKLPDTAIARIIKQSLPENARVGSTARKAIAHASAIFVLYTSTQAMRFASLANRKMINGNDLIRAMEEMGFPEFVPELESTLGRFRAHQVAKTQGKSPKPSSSAESPKKKLPNLMEGNEDEAGPETSQVKVADRSPTKSPNKAAKSPVKVAKISKPNVSPNASSKVTKDTTTRSAAKSKPSRSKASPKLKKLDKRPAKKPSLKNANTT